MTNRIDPESPEAALATHRIEISPVAFARTPFRERFGIPRQPGLVPEVPGRLVFLPPYDRPEAVEGLVVFSHVWLLFGFHANEEPNGTLTVRPPRLGGNRRVGVFASRSPYRPNRLGLSVVRLEGIDLTEPGPVLRLRGLDLLDGTPVYDVKPYVPYTDALPHATGGFAADAIPRLPVRFAAAADAQLAARPDREEARAVIVAVLALDPRPGYRQGETESRRALGMRLYDFDLRWRVAAGEVEVLELRPLRPG
ncbi:MAG: tRNA (N6-threonylcarbamoyladenosine(37)-N6)-methyltransferase TrmO [Acidobacteria bacterium]|nr:tRNA (N6-threonylcarbamoyladenosine(37)-N6)-methyltransferase TrmO [Acidobacteriota bacterium]